jgi:hypothetical protein
MKGVIQINNQDRQQKGQEKKDKGINNERHNTTLHESH